MKREFQGSDAAQVKAEVGTVRATLDKQIDAHGQHRLVRRPDREIDRDVTSLVVTHFAKRGFFLRSPQPHFHDQIDGVLIPMISGHSELQRMLGTLGLLPGERLTTLVEDTLVEIASHSAMSAVAISVPFETLSNFPTMQPMV